MASKNDDQAKKISKEKNILRRILLIICLITFLVSSTYLLHYFIEGRKAKAEFQAYSDITQESVVEPTSEAESEVPVITSPEPEVDPAILDQYKPLYLKNNDLIGWITIPDTVIDYPVVQKPYDNNFYLTHSFEGGSSRFGVPFLDYGCAPQDNSLLIHAHNMKDNSMFGSLTEYKDIGYWKDHKYITFNSLYEKQTYVIFAVINCSVLESSEEYFPYYQCVGTLSEDEYNEFTQALLDKSMYDTKKQPSAQEQLLVLSTCNYHADEGRFIVAAYKIPEEGETQ